jgi:hypothetical protein
MRWKHLKEGDERREYAVAESRREADKGRSVKCQRNRVAASEQIESALSTRRGRPPDEERIEVVWSDVLSAVGVRDH